VREVRIEGSAERKVVSVVSECAIDAAVAANDVFVLEPRKKFLLVSKSLCTTGWVAE
jgi:hypothetical protein